MKVRLARIAGFCMGVRRAMELALAAAHSRHGEGRIYTYGPLIHNPQVLELLRSKGVEVLDEIPPPGSVQGGTVIVRAHGVPPQDKQRLKDAGFTVITDGTCPRVIRVQTIIAQAVKRGRDVVIVGDPHHPEVVGLLGHAGERGYLVSRPEEVDDLPELGPLTVVAQTTQNEQLFADTVARLIHRFGEVKVHDTICEATHRRQAEVRRLAEEVDGVVVVGGKNSGNTRRLGQVAAEAGKKVFLVETDAELDREALKTLGSVGLTAGASTPNWMIKKVMRELATIRAEGEGDFTYWKRRLFRFLVRSLALVALGAAGMSIAACLLMGIAPNPVYTGVAFFYIYAMHVLNHFLDKEAGQYNEPDRAQFLTAHRHFLVGAGIISALAALVLCFLLGWVPLLLVTVMSALGLLYSIPVFPQSLERRIGIASLKDIPGSKTLSAALAWAFIVALLPSVSGGHAGSAAVPLAFVYTLVLVLVRCALFDILDVQGDLVVGKETIPIVLGEVRTRRWLRRVLAGLAALMFLAPLAGLAPWLSWWLILPVGGMALCDLALARGWLVPGALSEGLVDLNFSLAGTLALIWAAL